MMTKTINQNNNSLDNAHYYCQEKLKRGTSIHYSLYFADKKYKLALVAAHAFYREITDILNKCSDQGVARTKLYWWQEEIERLYAGEPRHPVTRALQLHVGMQSIDKNIFLSMITAVSNLVNGVRFASFSEFELYCHELHSSAFMLQALLTGVANKDSLIFQRDIAVFCKLVNVIRNVQGDLRKHRIYLPESSLTTYDINIAKLDDHAEQEKLKKLLHSLAKQAQQIYDDAFTKLAFQDSHDLKTTIILAELHKRLLDLLVAEDFPCLEQHITITPIRKLWHAWRISVKLG